MKEEKRKKAIEVLNLEISNYLKKVRKIIKLEAEIKLYKRETRKLDSLAELHGEQRKLFTVISDLSTVVRTLSAGEIETQIIGAPNNRTQILRETEVSIHKAGLNFDGDGYGRIWVFEDDLFEDD